jgi:hypothetical protein
MQKTEIVCGLPWLSSKPERAIFDELQFACIYAVGPSGGRPLRIGWARQLKDRMQSLQLGNPKELLLHECVWTAGDMLAIRVFNDVAATFDKAKRRLMSDWFDVMPDHAKQAIRLASDKLTVPTFSHGDMLQKVRAIRKSRIDAAVRAAN